MINMKFLNLKVKFFYIFLCFILLATNFVPRGLTSQPLKLTQNGYELEVLDVKNELVVNNNGTTLWSELITIVILENYTESKSINFIYNMEVRIEKILLNNTPSPSRMIADQDKSTIEIIPIFEINENEILIIELIGFININRENLQNENWLYRYNWGLNYVIPKMSLIIFLPESSFIEGSEDSLQVFPKGYAISSNGKSIIITWDNLVLAEPSGTNTVIFEIVIPIEDVYTNQRIENTNKSFHFQSFLLGILLVIFIFLSSIFILFKFYKISFRKYIDNLKYFLKSKEAKDGFDTTKIRTTRIPVIIKPQQKRILSIIQENGGTINQNDLVLQSGLSKARVSQYLKELDDLKLISREKQGRENLVYLKSDLN